MKEPPPLVDGCVVAFVELAHQVVAGLAFDLFGRAEEQDGRASVDPVDDAVANGHFVYLG